MYPTTCLGEQKGSFQAPRSPHLPFVISISVSRTPWCHRTESAGQLILLGSDIFPETKIWRGVPYFVWMELNFYTLVWTPSRHPHQGWWALQYTPRFRRASSVVTEPARRMNAPDAGYHMLSLTHWVLSLTPHKGHLWYSQESVVENWCWIDISQSEALSLCKIVCDRTCAGTHKCESMLVCQCECMCLCTLQGFYFFYITAKTLVLSAYRENPLLPYLPGSCLQSLAFVGL